MVGRKCVCVCVGGGGGGEGEEDSLRSKGQKHKIGALKSPKLESNVLF